MLWRFAGSGIEDGDDLIASMIQRAIESEASGLNANASQPEVRQIDAGSQPSENVWARIVFILFVLPQLQIDENLSYEKLKSECKWATSGVLNRTNLFFRQAPCF